MRRANRSRGPGAPPTPSTRRPRRAPRGALGLLLLALFAGPAAAESDPAPMASDTGDDALVDDRGESLGDVRPAAGRAAEQEVESALADGAMKDPDPWEGFNRKVFWLNEKADIYAMAPVARGWRFVVPAFARKGIENFNGFLLMPVVLGNGILQLKPKNAIQDVGRIVYNATFGIAGFIDVATVIGIPQNDEDFGQTLGFWGAPPGPYLVLPLFGPSNVRDGVGRLGDTAGTYYFSLLPIWATFLVRGVELVNLRARFLEEVDENRRESFDYYVFLRDAYLQNRKARVGRARGEEEAAAAPPEDDLYYFDDDFDEGFDDGFEDGDDGGVDDGFDDGDDDALDDPDGAVPAEGTRERPEAAGERASAPGEGRADAATPVAERP